MDDIKKVCAAEYGCQEAHVEFFKENPLSFFGWLFVSMPLFIIGMLLCFSPEKYYHTRLDSWDNMNKQGLADCYAVACKVLKYSENGYMVGK